MNVIYLPLQEDPVGLDPQENKRLSISHTDCSFMTYYFIICHKHVPSTITYLINNQQTTIINQHKYYFRYLCK